jgi:RNA-directed DNA polymerase
LAFAAQHDAGTAPREGADSLEPQRVKDVRVLIRDINPMLRGWGNYFRTGNAAAKFNRIDTYVWRRLTHFMVRRKGRHLRATDVEAWTSDFFHNHGLHRLRGTVQYPEAA